MEQRASFHKTTLYHTKQSPHKDYVQNSVLQHSKKSLSKNKLIDW